MCRPACCSSSRRCSSWSRLVNTLKSAKIGVNTVNESVAPPLNQLTGNGGWVRGGLVAVKSSIKINDLCTYSGWIFSERFAGNITCSFNVTRDLLEYHLLICRKKRFSFDSMLPYSIDYDVISSFSSIYSNFLHLIL